MTWRDSITRWRAKGLWIGMLAEPDAGLHTEGGNRVIGRGELRLRISGLPVWAAAKVAAGEPI